MTTAELIPEYVQAAAIAVAGFWAYWRFFHQRSGQPATDIDLELRFLGTQGSNLVIEVAAILENKSLVRHSYDNFRLRVRYLTPHDEIKDSEDPRILHQLDFPHSIDDRFGPPSPDRPVRLFGTVDYINPRQRFQHRYPTYVPAEVTFVWVHCRFDFRQSLSRRLKDRVTRRPTKRPYTDAQRVFSVPGVSATPVGEHAGESHGV
jgi:hypothetical protein